MFALLPTIVPSATVRPPACVARKASSVTVSSETIALSALSQLKHRPHPPQPPILSERKALAGEGGAWVADIAVGGWGVTQQMRKSDIAFTESLRMGLRASAVNVSLLTTRDPEGRYHGLAVTTAVPFSTQQPSMIVAVSHSASAYPVIRDSGLFCLNQITSQDLEILDRFCRSDLRAARFTSEAWRPGPSGLPYLETATASFFCAVLGAHDYGDQTVFVSRIGDVRLGGRGGPDGFDPLIWINGGPAKLAGREYA